MNLYVVECEHQWGVMLHSKREIYKKLWREKIMSIIFSKKEVTEANCILELLAMHSAMYWSDVLVSPYFISCDNLTNDHYLSLGASRCRVRANRLDISARQLNTFINAYRQMAKNWSNCFLIDNEYIANILGYKIVSVAKKGSPDAKLANVRLETSNGEKIAYIVTNDIPIVEFGGIDNEPKICLKYALEESEIQGIFIGERKTKIVLQDRKICKCINGFINEKEPIMIV